MQKKLENILPHCVPPIPRAKMSIVDIWRPWNILMLKITEDSKLMRTTDSIHLSISEGYDDEISKEEKIIWSLVKKIVLGIVFFSLTIFDCKSQNSVCESEIFSFFEQGFRHKKASCVCDTQIMYTDPCSRPLCTYRGIISL